MQCRAVDLSGRIGPPRSEEFVDRLPRPDDGDRPPGGVGEMQVEWDTEGPVDRGQDVLGGDRPLLHVPAARLARADDPPALHAAAAEEDGEAVGPVVAPRVAVDERGAAE